MRHLLIGALDMIEAGMKPSDAVTCGADPLEVEGLPGFLGVPSLKSLNRMAFDELSELLSRYSMSSISESRVMSSRAVG